jgi:YidC/Oxa1 family membrane protein insertase
MVKGMPKTSGSNDMMAQQQKIMLYVFPVIFAVSGVNFPVGVLIYWGTTNLWTFGQQYYVIKRNPTPGSPAYIELMEKRAKKGLTGGATPTESNGTTQTLNPDNGSTGAQNPQSPQRKQPKKRKPKK